MTAPLDVTRLRAIADRLAELGCEPEAEEVVQDLTQVELGGLATEFERRAEVEWAEATEIEGALRRAAVKS